MLNREKYGNEIIELAVNKGIFALKDGKPMLCRDINCKDCDFYVITACKGNTYYFREWLNSEYVEPPVDWSKVAVDTPILVRDHENCEWTRRHFAKINKNGTVFAWRGGATSWSEDDEETIPWKYAKLAESEE